MRITPVEVELKGSYPQVMSFLDETAHVKRIIAAKSLELDRPEARAGISVVSAKATIYAYRIESEIEAANRIQGATKAATTAGAAAAAPPPPPAAAGTGGQ